MTVVVPRAGIVILIGASASGKSSFARKHFSATEIVSSDACRAMVADREDALRASRDAFGLVHAIAAARSRHRRLTVIDATNARRDSRKPLVDIARQAGLPVVAIVFDLPEAVLLERSLRRQDGRAVPMETIRSHARDVRRSLPGLSQEGFAEVTVLRSQTETDAAVVTRGQH